MSVRYLTDELVFFLQRFVRCSTFLISGTVVTEMSMPTKSVICSDVWEWTQHRIRSTNMVAQRRWVSSIQVFEQSLQSSIHLLKSFDTLLQWHAAAIMSGAILPKIAQLLFVTRHKNISRKVQHLLPYYHYLLLWYNIIKIRGLCLAAALVHKEENTVSIFVYLSFVLTQWCKVLF